MNTLKKTIAILCSVHLLAFPALSKAGDDIETPDPLESQLDSASGKEKPGKAGSKQRDEIPASNSSQEKPDPLLNGGKIPIKGNGKIERDERKDDSQITPDPLMDALGDE